MHENRQLRRVENPALHFIEHYDNGGEWGIRASNHQISYILDEIDTRFSDMLARSFLSIFLSPSTRVSVTGLPVYFNIIICPLAVSLSLSLVLSRLVSVTVLGRLNLI